MPKMFPFEDWYSALVQKGHNPIVHEDGRLAQHEMQSDWPFCHGPVCENCGPIFICLFGCNTLTDIRICRGPDIAEFKAYEE